MLTALTTIEADTSVGIIIKKHRSICVIVKKEDAAGLYFPSSVDLVQIFLLKSHWFSVHNLLKLRPFDIRC
jgi:hypothetical protein